MKGTWQTTDSGGGGLVLVLVVVALAIGSGAASAAVTAMEVVLIITGVVIVLAVAGVAAYLVHRARQDRPGRPIAAPPVYQLPPAQRPELSSEHKTAIGPARETHLHFHVSPDELAAIMRRYTEEDQP